MSKILVVDNEEAFDDALHALIYGTRRPMPEDTAATQDIRAKLEQLVSLAGNDPQRWKTLCLALSYKRYHVLSPEAKAQERNDGNHAKITGNGERLIFYKAARYIFENQEGDEATKALSVMCRIAPLAGGTRDICTLIREFVHSSNDTGLQQTRNDMIALDGKESLTSLVGSAVQHVHATTGAGRDILDSLLQVAADLLDEDLGIVEHDETNQDSSGECKKLPSTFHVFLPHRDRGRGGKKRKRDSVSDQQLVNSVAEVLIWTKTKAAMSNKAFVACYDKFLQGVSTANKDTIKANLHIMQCIIRKEYRQKLNSFARNNGFMLSDQFTLDPSVVNVKRIKCGKTYDIASLTHLATKKQDSRILKLINLRFSDPSRATKFGSVNEIIRDWAPQPEDDNEILQLQRDIVLAKVKATLQYLGNVVNPAEKTTLVASMDNSTSNHVAAVLVSAALAPVDVEGAQDVVVVESSQDERVRLFLGGVQQNVSTLDSVVSLLDEIMLGVHKNKMDAPTFMTDNTATTKAVLNLIERHVKDNENLLLISSADLVAPSDVMSSLVARGCGIHCHDAEAFGERLKREGARKGDVTVSLAWDTFDDLDLHVFTPSGEEVYYANKSSNDGLCHLDVDMNVGGKDSEEPVENVFIGDLDHKKQAPLGHYKVVVHNFAYHSKGSTAQTAIRFRVIVDKNGVKERFSGECVGSGSIDTSNVVVCEFDYTGRTVPFPGEEEDKLEAFGSSNLVNLTVSTGQTLESLSQLTQTLVRLEHLDQARLLVNDDDDDEDSKEEARSSDIENKHENTEASRPLVAETGRLEVTSRDLLRMQLANLPANIHRIVGEAFGGPTLADECAKEISQRMVADKVPISELKRHGYPDDIIELVKKYMATTIPSASN